MESKNSSLAILREPFVAGMDENLSPIMQRLLPAGDGDVSRGHLVDLEELHHIEPEEGDQDDGERQADLHPVQKVDVDANGLTDQADAGGVGGGADDSCHAADGGGVGDGQDHGFL